MRFFFQNISQDCSANFMRRSCECREPVAAKFWRIYNANFCDTRTNVVRVSYYGRETVLRKHVNTSRLSGDKVKLSDIRTNVMRHSHECLETVVQMKNEKKLRSRESRETHSCLATVVQQLLDYRATVARHISKVRPKFAYLLHKCPFNETAT